MTLVACSIGGPITAITFNRAASQAIATGLLGHVSVTIAGIQLNGISLRRRPDGGLLISFPTVRDRRGYECPIIKPTDPNVQRTIERAIIRAVAREVGA